MVLDLKISVIIPNYNYDRYVGNAIRSVLSQRYEYCEVIVVDDGSTDDSWEIIRSFPEVKAIKIQNSGQLAACRAGLREASSPFVMFLDADDELKPGSLIQIATRLDPSVAKLQFSLTRIDSNGQFVAGASPSLKNFIDKCDIVREIQKKGTYITPPTSGNVFRRDVAELIEEVNYERVVDGVILFAAPFMGTIISLSDELGCYRVHGSNHSGGGKPPNLEAVDAELKRYCDRLEHLRNIVTRLRPELKLVQIGSGFFYLERSFYREIVLNKRPSISLLLRLLYALLTHNINLKNKIGLIIAIILMAVLPSSRARAILNYRFQAEQRSLPGLLYAALSGEQKRSH